MLKEAGSGIEKVVKVNVFLTSMDYFAEMNSVYEKFFKHKPARSELCLFLFLSSGYGVDEWEWERRSIVAGGRNGLGEGVGKRSERYKDWEETGK